MPIKDIYRNSHLPKEGWFQSCFLCSTITARTEKYNKNRKYYKVFLCPYCEINLKITESMRLKFKANLVKRINAEEKWFNEMIRRKPNRQKLMQEIRGTVLAE